MKYFIASISLESLNATSEFLDASLFRTNTAMYSESSTVSENVRGTSHLTKTRLIAYYEP